MKNKNLKSLNKDKDWFMDRVGSKVLAKGGKNRFNGEMVILDIIHAWELFELYQNQWGFEFSDIPKEQEK